MNVDHETKIGPFAHVAPGVVIAGRVRVKEGAFIGMGSSVREKITIGPWATVGAGSVVVKNIPSKKIVFGNPAREKK